MVQSIDIRLSICGASMYNIDAITKTFPPQILERFVERAGKYEYTAGMTRNDAERRAVDDCLDEVLQEVGNE